LPKNLFGEVSTSVSSRGSVPAGANMSEMRPSMLELSRPSATEMSTCSPLSGPGGDAETSVVVRRHVVRIVLAVDTRPGFAPVLALWVVREGSIILAELPQRSCDDIVSRTYALF
jgi:hypothetical protein